MQLLTGNESGSPGGHAGSLTTPGGAAIYPSMSSIAPPVTVREVVGAERDRSYARANAGATQASPSTNSSPLESALFLG